MPSRSSLTAVVLCLEPFKNAYVRTRNPNVGVVAGGLIILRMTTVIHIRVPVETRDLLREHADGVGRTLMQEVRIWLQLAAAASDYVALINPRVGEPHEKLLAGRVEALALLRTTLARALPHHIAPELLANAFAIPPSMN